MLLRRITQHIKDQNWVAVLLDFLIVVIGVFMGFQVNNWNNFKQDSRREVALMEQLRDEFSEIVADLEVETSDAAGRLQASKHIIEVIDKDLRPDDERTRLALISNMGLGRSPSASATYRQLVSSGDLTLLKNDELRRALIRYHDSIDKNAFLFEQALATVSNYLATNDAIIVDVNVVNFSKSNADTISRIDWEGLREQRPYFVNMFIFNNLFNGFYRSELHNAEDVLSQLDGRSLE